MSAIAPAAASAVLHRESTGGFGVRFLARVIDFVAAMIVAFAAGIVAAVILALLEQRGTISPGWESRVQGGLAVSILLGLVSAVIAETVTESVAGTSLGKLLLGYRIVSLDGPDAPAPCRPRAAFIRSIAYFIDSLFFGVVAVIAMQQSDMNQRLGDTWGNAAVAKSSTLPVSAKRDASEVALGLAVGFALRAAFAAGPMLLRAAL